MTHLGNDRWRGVCTVYENATYEYTVEAWADTFAGWQHEFGAKFDAGIANLTSETLEGAALLEEAGAACGRHSRTAPGSASSRRRCAPLGNAEVNAIAHSRRAGRVMASYPGSLGCDAIHAGAARHSRPREGAHRGLVRVFPAAPPKGGATKARRSVIASRASMDAKAMGF
jgi:hypothetical protein